MIRLFVYSLTTALVARTGLAGLLGQAGSSIPFDWPSLLSGVIGSSPTAIALAWRLSRADTTIGEKDKVIAEKDEELRAMHQLNVAMVEKQSPLLAQSVRLLAEFGTVDRDRAGAVDRLATHVATLANTVDRDRRDRRGPQ